MYLLCAPVDNSIHFSTCSTQVLVLCCAVTLVLKQYILAYTLSFCQHVLYTIYTTVTIGHSWRLHMSSYMLQHFVLTKGDLSTETWERACIPLWSSCSNIHCHRGEWKCIAFSAIALLSRGSTYQGTFPALLQRRMTLGMYVGTRHSL